MGAPRRGPERGARAGAGGNRREGREGWMDEWMGRNQSSRRTYEWVISIQAHHHHDRLVGWLVSAGIIMAHVYLSHIPSP